MQGWEDVTCAFVSSLEDLAYKTCVATLKIIPIKNFKMFKKFN